MSSRSALLFVFCLANVAISFSFAALAACVPAMSHSLGQSEDVISQISAYYMIPYGLGALAYIPLARFVSYKTILVAAMFVYAVTNFICASTTSIQVILAARILMGLAAACVIPLCLISIGRAFEKEKRGQMVGLFFSTSFIASVIGIGLSAMGRWQLLFCIPGFLALQAVIVILMNNAPDLNIKSTTAPDYLRVWRQDKIRDILLFIFVLSFLYHGIHKWLAVYLHRQYGFEQWLVSSCFILIALTGAFGQNIGGAITDRLGRVIACYWGLLILAAATMLLLGKYPAFILAGILSLFSIGWAIGHNGVSTVLTDFPDENRSEIAGLNSAIRFFSGGLGFFVGGPFVEKNISLTFFVFGVVMMGTSFFVKKIIPQTSV